MQREASKVLRQIAQGISVVANEAFFHSLVQHLAQALGVGFAFIGELKEDDQKQAIETIALWSHGSQIENFEYQPQPPCANVINGTEVCSYPHSVQQLFPHNPWLRDWQLDSYIGMPLIGSDGQMLGLLTVMDCQPIANPELAAAMLKIFGVRASAELERKRSETALRQSEARYRVVSELISAFAYAFSIDAKGRPTLEWVTDSLTTLIGFTEAEVKQLGWAIVFPDDQPAVKQWFRALVYGTATTQEYRVVTKTGQVIWLRSHALPEWNPQQQVMQVYAAAHDITQQKAVEAQLQALNADLERQVQERTAQLHAEMQKLQQLNHLKDDFLSTVSHELRTPLTNMKMAIYALKTLQSSAERRSHYLRILQDECQRETDLINDLLDLQRLEANVDPVQLEPLALHTWLPSVLQPFESRAQHHQQCLSVSLPKECLEVQSNAADLGRILAELLNNACKYTPIGGSIQVNVQISSLSPASTCVLTVLNQAEIPPAELSRIFDKFYRIPGADRRQQGGTGLGLALVRKLAERLGGQIAVASQDGWTAFTLTLPQPVAAVA